MNYNLTDQQSRFQLVKVVIHEEGSSINFLCSHSFQLKRHQLVSQAEFD